MYLLKHKVTKFCLYVCTYVVCNVHIYTLVVTRVKGTIDT